MITASELKRLYHQGKNRTIFAVLSVFIALLITTVSSHILGISSAAVFGARLAIVFDSKLPLAVVTSLLGFPFFIYVLLIRRRRSWY